MRIIGADLNAVTIFAKVAELRSFRASALALGIPTSTVSEKIVQLEEHLGARLFERTTRSVRVTEAGMAYHAQISPALDAIRDGARAVAGLQAEPSGLIRIVAPAEFNDPILSDVIAEYSRRYEAVKIHIELTDRRVDLIEEGYDLALRAGPLDDSSVIARKLGGPQRLLVYASADYLRRRGTPRRPRDLLDHDCLVMTAHREAERWRFHGKRAEIEVAIRPRVSANSFGLLRALSAAGRGITRLPEAMSRATGSASRLRCILEEFSPPPRHWHALYPSARNLSAKVRALLDLLEQRFDAWTEPTRG